jgi:hypothetical protein
LFNNFPNLDADMVALSCAWYRKWSKDTYFAENLDYTFRLLKNNTETTLWEKCMEEYTQYAAPYRGGPLMFFLILRRIHSTSESALQFLLNKVRTLKIRDIQGEDVDLAISLIRSCHSMLHASSTVDHNYIPDDFPQIVLRALQTTSNHSFNRAFELEESNVQHTADKENRKPVWPDIEKVLNMATNIYNRLTGSNKWLTSRDHRRRAYVAGPGGARSNGHPNGRQQQGYRRRCWNCGSQDHELPDCPSPKDEAKIEKARQDYLKFKRQNQPRFPRRDAKHGRRPPETRLASDGTPMLRNRRGRFVPDQRRIHLARKSERTRALNAAIDTLAATAAAEEQPGDRTPIQNNTTSSQQTALAAQIDKVKLSASKLFR